jgi:diaminopimelate epimerase
MRHATVDVGNPHLVVEVADPDAVDLAVEGAEIERQFAEGINVEYVTVEAPDRIRLRVWERGAGITEACGSGACAAAHAAHAWGAVDDRVVVAMPGGEAEVRLEEDGSITLCGPSVHIADIEVPLLDDAPTDVKRARLAVEA